MFAAVLAPYMLYFLASKGLCEQQIKSVWVSHSLDFQTTTARPESLPLFLGRQQHYNTRTPTIVVCDSMEQ